MPILKQPRYSPFLPLFKLSRYGFHLSPIKPTLPNKLPREYIDYLFDLKYHFPLKMSPISKKVWSGMRVRVDEDGEDEYDYAIPACMEGDDDDDDGGGYDYAPAA
ncbi:hypothetical protein LIER_04574 [Lithospermum erythrorhizon]|uniref:Uncharacterized protein n=1 Tax=Lithospermum erythrorhizon TaxID=34254 RepID=A0AAV3P1Y0_LITER